MAEEKRYENQIKGFLKEEGAWFIKYWAGAQYTKNGIPDLLACVNGYFVAIEVKAKRGKPSELQLYNLNKIEQAGGFAFLLYPEQWLKFREFIRMLNDNKLGVSAVVDLYEDIKGW